MSVGPSPEWNKVPVKWEAVYLDGTAPSGTLDITVTWDRAIDEDPVDPLLILGSPTISIPIVQGAPTTFELPANDDPDISRQGFTYTVNENLDQGGGAEYSFEVSLNNLPDGVFLVRSFPGVSAAEGESGAVVIAGILNSGETPPVGTPAGTVYLVRP